MIKALFKGLCPNCGGDISSERLFEGLPCDRCLPEKVPREKVCSSVESGKLKELCGFYEKTARWEKHFLKAFGVPPWSLQKSWAKKVFLNRSFALLAPTGVGKSTFGISMASFLAKESGKSFIILPTKLLIQSTYEKIREAGFPEKDLLVFGDMTPKQKRIAKERLERGDFKVLISSSMFLYKNFEIIPKDFEFIFIDDVDSFLKTARNVDKVLTLLGFSEKDIEEALELIKLKDKRNKSSEDWEVIKERSQAIRELQKKRKGVLVVSSATGNPRSNRIKLFRELLGFEVGRPTFYIRNVEDLYEECKDMESCLIKKVKDFGKGGLVFVSSDYGREGVERLKKLLEEKGVKTATYEELNEDTLSKFQSGEIDVLIGISSYRNPLARGIDMPVAVRYAVFYGVPKIVIKLNIEAHVSHLLWALLSLRPLIAREEKLKDKLKDFDTWIQRLRRYSYISEDFINRNPNLKAAIERLRDEIGEFLTQERVVSLIESSQEITLRKEEDGYTLVVADITGYLQASGRTSRMFAGGITKGISLILVDDYRAFRNLEKKIRWLYEEINFREIGEVNFKEILEEVDKDRKKVKDILDKKIKEERKEYLKPVLLVVESPNKARTIANFFGKPIQRKLGSFELLEIAVGNVYLSITASLGHVFDLVKEGGFHGVVVHDGDFEPVYGVIEGKAETIRGLIDVSLEVEDILVGTDPDTEGEKIGWDVGNLLSPFARGIKRIEFNEVTRKAIRRSIENPRDFNESLVKAQVLRRVADRWVGFEVSRILQREFGKQWLSGGRVQIPVLGWIVEREELYRKKRYVVQITWKEEGRWLRIEFEFKEKKEAKEFFESLKNLKVKVLKEEEENRPPPPPYRTDTLLRDMSERYKFSLSKSMEVAQTLFELGFITYHRTDYLRVSDAGLSLAKSYISEEFGEDFYKPRRWAEGGAHECIRPTKPLEPEELRALVLSGQVSGLNRDHLLMYERIFRRFMASQMKEVKLKKKELLVEANGIKKQLAIYTDVVEEGFDRIYPVDLMPDLRGEIDVTKLKELKELPQAYLYTQGSIVEEMKKKGIGKPSTYATVISKLIDRGYVIDRKGFLIPTKLGKEVYAFIKSQQHILPFVSEEFTRELEAMMDSVEEGKEDYKNILKTLYKDIIEFEEVVRR